MTPQGWNWQDDEQFNRAYRAYQEKAVDVNDLDPNEPVPASLYQSLIKAYERLDAECAVAHKQVKQGREQLQHAYRELQHRSEAWRAAYHEAERSRRFAMLACLMAAVMTIIAAFGWLR